MGKNLDNFFLTIEEPYQSELLFLRQFFISEMGLQKIGNLTRRFIITKANGFGIYHTVKTASRNLHWFFKEV